MSAPARAPGNGRVAFLVVASAALAAAIAQVALGGVVRVTDSGLGCPDWPLCHGRLIPPMELTTLIEYSHRLSASVLGLLTLGATAIAWRYHRSNHGVTWACSIALAMVVVAAALGGATVLTELAWWFVLVHLGVAEIVVACMVVAVAAGWLGAPRAGTGPDRGDRRLAHPLVLSVLAGGLAVILLGSLMVGLGYGSTCATWPLCRGSLIPSGEPALIHMSHRFAAALLGLLVGGMAVAAWRGRHEHPGVWWAAAVAAGLVAAQGLAGAATVWSGFSATLKAVHLSLATLLWASVVLVAALNYSGLRLEMARPWARRSPPAGLEGGAT